jgi:hypothetical protein
MECAFYIYLFPMQSVLWVSIYVYIEEKEGVYLSYKNIGPISTGFSGMERNLGYLTARPGLGLDIIHFNLEDFFVDANIITQKEDHFDRRVRENFHRVNEKMGT